MLSNEQRDHLKQQVHEQLLQDQQKLLYSQPLLAMLMMRLKLVVVIDDRLKTAATDGTHIFADARFMRDLRSIDRVFVLAHEVWHCALLHLTRRHKFSATPRHKMLWNIACDYEVNHIVDEILNYHPKFALFDSAFKGKAAEHIYILLQAKQAEGHKAPFDVHDAHEAFMSSPASTADEQEIDDDYQPVQATNRDAERWQQYVVQAAQIVSRQNGALPAGVRRRLQQLLRPQLPWTEILRTHVEQCAGLGYTWQRPNRRHISQDVYLPGHRSEKLDIVVAIDTSGSTQRELPRFFGELCGILASFDHVRVQVIECDAAVHQHQVFDEHEIGQIQNWQPQGGGGTSFTPVFNYIENPNHHVGRPRLLVFFTDGYGTAPTQAPNYPVLWVLTTHGEAPCDWGKIVRIEESIQ